MPDARPDAPPAASGLVHRALAHDSAVGHVTGAARYVDDLPVPRGTLHACVGGSPVAHGRIRLLDLEPVRSAPGVVAVLTAADIPGENNVGPVLHDEPVFAEREVAFHGQPLFLAVARTREQARAAVRCAHVEVDPLPAILTVEQALAAGSLLDGGLVFERGDPDGALARAAHRLEGEIRIGGQEHFYLEGQVTLAVPLDRGEMLLHCSTQHPSEVQELTARALALPSSAVTVEVRRMGGAFGGKETQAAPFAVMAALAAFRLQRPVKLRLDRDDDFAMTGKRHDFLARWRVGFDDRGGIEAADLMLASRCGISADLSGAINDRAMFHADNAYCLPAVRITSHRCRTNTVSNTAFRGFGGPQGMVVIERIMDAVASRLGLDPLAVRRANLYGEGDRAVTPYGMVVEDNVAPALIGRLAELSDYEARRRAVAALNAAGGPARRGIALTPVKFGISFTTTFLNQAGALVHIYRDGSVHLNHGGTEMGQGLFVKVAQVTADVLGLPLDRVAITATRTDKVPNTSATAASSGTDLNAKAAEIAALTLRSRLAEVFRTRTGSTAAEVRFAAGRVGDGLRDEPFEAVVGWAYLDRVSLSATGYYRTPKIEWDRAAGKGRPFLYFAYGAAVSEVEIDTRTGESRVLAVDILHDVGRSLNPAIDLGQIEGGFVQGMGWLTMEELVFDADGRLATHAPSTYKIPCAGDRPARLTIHLFDNANAEDTIHRSKAVGEPPLMLAISVHSALAHAVHGVDPEGPWPDLDTPATPERILRAVEAARARRAGASA